MNCVEVMFNEEERVTTKDVRSTHKMSDDTAPGPDGIRYKDIYDFCR